MRRLLLGSLLVFVAGGLIYYWWCQYRQNPEDEQFRAYESWQWGVSAGEE